MATEKLNRKQRKAARKDKLRQKRERCGHGGRSHQTTPKQKRRYGWNLQTGTETSFSGRR